MIFERLEKLILRLIKLIEALLAHLNHSPTAITITQIQGDTFMPITGTPAGGTSTFGETPTPAGTSFPAGTTFVWSVDDTADISFTPSTDGTQVACSCTSTPTQSSYNLTCTSNFTPTGATAPLSATVNVPILPAVAPQPSGMTINQLS